ncbi:MAG: transglycosylase, partial [Micavibrio aeruginosavorus]
GRIYKPALKRTDDQNADATAMIASIRRSIQIYEPSAALRTFNESKATIYLDDVEKDRVRALIASGYLYAGKLDDAERLSGAAMRSSGTYAPLAGWVHGLTLWRKGHEEKSASSFEVAANSPYATGWMVSAASYWASRAHKEAGHNRRANNFLEKAASNPKTFYGLLATQALGRKMDLSWEAPRLSAADERAIITSTAGLRAERLLAAGEVARAEAEIRSLYIKGDAARKRALLAYAYDRRLPSLTLRLSHALSYDQNTITDAGYYPSMPWTPNQGYRIDRALIHAIARQESRFNALAENKRSGATGLMQMMPATAAHVSRTEIYQANEGRGLLKTPEISLDLGQKYVEELLNSPQVGQDLFSLAIAYNAGPGTLAKWKAERADINDPLLFIETIPYAETRTYVERVMANYWIYRMKFDQPNDSMVALAEGKWARYAAYDKGALKFADAR